MNGQSFNLKIITPARTSERTITYIRLKDGSGFFGILRNYADFITVLPTSLGYYNDLDGKEIFIAIEEGILSVRNGVVVLTAREVFEGEDAGALSEIIDKTVLARSGAETALSGLLKGMEAAFIEKTIELEKQH
ncbi:MAG: hypothetical protein M0Z52_09680 [Actinomycetota bacterium]|nr:hypothetical protein [Actinomycetota bacterium]